MVFIDWFYPAFKAGGPIKSMSNMVSLLSNDIDFFFVTSDRDLLDNKAYENVRLDVWVKKPDYSIIYLSESNRKKSQYKKLFNYVNPHTVYINGIFSYNFSIKPLLVFKNSNTKLILATRGMLGQNSLKVKSIKKKCFLFFMNTFSNYKNVIWHLNSTNELQELKKSISAIHKTIILPNLSFFESHSSVNHQKIENELNLISICRVLPIKNIHFVIELLKLVKFNCHYFIAGPIEDVAYYKSCLTLINDLPANVKVVFLGTIKPNEIINELNKADFFISSSLNENYGHSIVEALGASKPIIISDKTPWKNLAYLKAGADLPLEKKIYIDQLNKFAKMNNKEYSSYSDGAKSFFDNNMNPNLFKDRYIELLTS